MRPGAVTARLSLPSIRQLLNNLRRKAPTCAWRRSTPQSRRSSATSSRCKATRRSSFSGTESHPSTTVSLAIFLLAVCWSFICSLIKKEVQTSNHRSLPGRKMRADRLPVSLVFDVSVDGSCSKRTVFQVISTRRSTVPLLFFKPKKMK